MRPFNPHSLAAATLLLCSLFARHAAAAPPPTTLAIPTAPAAEPATVAPPSEPYLQLARPTSSPDLELDFKAEVEDPEHELDLREVTTVTAAAAPGITPAPDFDADTSGGEWWHTGVDGNGDTFRYRQTTYYTCVTQGLTEHCGIHRPILEVSGAGGLGESQAFGVGGRAVLVGLLAGGFAYLMGR